MTATAAECRMYLSENKSHAERAWYIVSRCRLHRGGACHEVCSHRLNRSFGLMASATYEQHITVSCRSTSLRVVADISRS